MDIGDRIKARRKALGLSAETVAEKIGVSAATVYRYESNDIESMRADKLLPIARVLMTTPGYLMGWRDAPTDLSPSETELIEIFRSSNEAGREYLMNTARMVADNPAMQKEKGETASA